MPRRLVDLVDPFQPYTDQTPPARVGPFVWHHLRPLRRVAALSLSLSVLGAVLEVWLIFYAGRLIDVLAATTPERLWADHGTELLLVAALIVVARPLVGLAGEAIDDIAFRPNAVTLIRWRAHRQVLGQSVGWFQNDLSGRVATRVREIGVAAAGAAYTVLHTLSFVVIYLVGSFWLMSATDLRLLIPLVIWVALYLALMAYAVPRFRDTSQRFQEAESALTGMLVDAYANVDVLKLYADPGDGREGRERFEESRAAYARMQRLEVAINVGMMTLGTLLMVSVVGYSIVLWQAGDAPLGLVAAAVALAFRTHGMAEWLLDAVAALFGFIGAARESLTTVAQPRDIPDAPDARELTVDGGAIRLCDVSHHYGRGDGGLDRVSLDIAAGEKVGLVGRSGAGKSTMVNLVLRFFEVERGRIEIDGQDLREVTQDSLRRHIAVVGQDAVLLHRSIRDNLTLGRAGITQADVEMAARMAEADAFIPDLRDRSGRTGYDAHVGERGVKLSGGQRQRIALARAILKDAPILVLDEATSALDSEGEAAIQHTLHRIMEGRTVLAVAHRLSTIAHLDRIVVLDVGRIVEEGTHDQLLADGRI
jgi:ATP-binding cassette subfamily B multidrug efflux pump